MSENCEDPNKTLKHTYCPYWGESHVAADFHLKAGHIICRKCEQGCPPDLLDEARMDLALK